MHAFSDLSRGPSASELRGLRWVLSVVGPALGLWLYLADHRPVAALSVSGVALGLCLLSLVPGVGTWIYLAWMGLGLALRRVTSPVLLAIIWLFLFVPVGVASRVVGRDPMKRRFPAADATFWEPYLPCQDIHTYFRQF